MGETVFFSCRSSEVMFRRVLVSPVVNSASGELEVFAKYKNDRSKSLGGNGGFSFLFFQVTLVSDLTEDMNDLKYILFLFYAIIVS